MSAPTTTITGKVINQKAQAVGNGQTVYYSLLEVPPEGRERNPKHYKLTTFSSTDNGMLATLRKLNQSATIVCQVKGRYNKNKELIIDLIPVDIIVNPENS